jgi:hypothetical protein
MVSVSALEILHRPDENCNILNTFKVSQRMSIEDSCCQLIFL